MLTLDAAKRPSINDILATPLIKARISKFLSATLVNSEFSHTVIHGRPQPGKLVPEITNSALPRSAFSDIPPGPMAPAGARPSPVGLYISASVASVLRVVNCKLSSWQQ